MRVLTKISIIVFLAAVFAGISAQKKDYSKEPGYVNFGDLSRLENDDSGTEVFLEEHLLKMAAKLSQKEDPKVAELINGLKLVKVNEFKANAKNEAKIESKIQSIDKELMGNKWDRIVKSKNKGENANVYIKTTPDEKICGLVVVAFKKGKEAAFVNIVGNIDLEAIGSLNGKFDIPGLKGLSNKKKQ
jgi:hypothetical protein